MTGSRERTGANLVLPLAGADVKNWLATELPNVKIFSLTHKQIIDGWTDFDMIFTPELGIKRQTTIYYRIGQAGFDYCMDPVCETEGSPTPQFQRFKPLQHERCQNSHGNNVIDYSYVTLNGVVVEGTRVNYALLVAYLRYAGWPAWLIKKTGDVEQFWRSRGWDTPAAHAAVDLGANLADSTIVPIPVESIATHARVLSMQDPVLFNASFYWPAQLDAVMSESTFVMPGFMVRACHALYRKRELSMREAKASQ